MQGKEGWRWGGEAKRRPALRRLSIATSRVGEETPAGLADPSVWFAGSPRHRAGEQALCVCMSDERKRIPLQISMYVVLKKYGIIY